jgi:hypothetical protein
MSDKRLHLWARDTSTPDAIFEAWRRMYPSGHASDSGPGELPSTETVDGEPDQRLAITCIGPAGAQAPAQLAERVKQANARVRAVTVVQLDELTVAHGVVDPDFLRFRPQGPGSGDLDQLLHAESTGPVRAFKVFWSVLPPPPPMPVDRRVLWMKWSIETRHQLSPDVVAMAWRAVSDACAEWAPEGPSPEPRVDYVVSRVRHGGRLQGLAKVVLDLEVIRDRWPDGKGNGGWLRRFCAEIEARWRTDLESTLRPRRSDLVVAWTESWLAARSPARRR